MRAFQSLIERSLYVLLMITVIVNVILGVLLYANITRINQQQTQIKYAVSAVEKNQKSNTVVMLNYFACLLRIKPQDQNINQQEQACYAGGVK